MYSIKSIIQKHPAGTVYIGLLAAVMLISGCASNGSSRGSRAVGTDKAYFSKTDSRANVYVSPIPSSIKKVAILPFEAPTTLIGKAVSEMFVTEMLKAGRYTLVERGQITKLLRESELALSGISAADAVELGNMLGAEGVIIGTVDEYGTIAIKGNTYPSTAVSLRLISCKTSKVVWSVDLASRATKKGVTIAIHARDTVHEMMAGLYNMWWERDPPQKPMNVSVSDMGLREVIVTWTDSGGNATQFRIDRSTSRSGSFETIAYASPGAEEYTDRSDLGDATAYYYRVVALNSVKETDCGVVLESFTAPPPEPPVNVEANASGPREVTLTWSPSKSESVVSYQIERASAKTPDRFTAIDKTAGTEFRDGGSRASTLDDSSVYLYRVQSINRVDSVGLPSETCRVTTQPPPDPVKGVEAKEGQVRLITLTWQTSPDQAVTGYEIFRSKDGNKTALHKSIRGRTKTELMDGGKEPGNLEDDTVYQYEVYAVNRVGSRSASATRISASTRGAPPSVSGFYAEAGLPRKVKLSWRVCADEKVNRYEIHRASGDQTMMVLATINDVKTTTYTDRGNKGGFSFGKTKLPESTGNLSDGTEYRYIIKAVNIGNTAGPDSLEVRATTKAPPATPIGLRAETAEGMSLKWLSSSESNIDRYIIESSKEIDGKYRMIGELPHQLGMISFIDEKAKVGKPKFYRVTTVDKDGIPSSPSESVKGEMFF